MPQPFGQITNAVRAVNMLLFWGARVVPMARKFGGVKNMEKQIQVPESVLHNAIACISSAENAGVFKQCVARFKPELKGEKK